LCPPRVVTHFRAEDRAVDCIGDRAVDCIGDRAVDCTGDDADERSGVVRVVSSSGIVDP
jgi:hypothetical protein